MVLKKAQEYGKKKPALQRTNERSGALDLGEPVSIAFMWKCALRSREQVYTL